MNLFKSTANVEQIKWLWGQRAADLLTRKWIQTGKMDRYYYLNWKNISETGGIRQ